MTTKQDAMEAAARAIFAQGHLCNDLQECTAAAQAAVTAYLAAREAEGPNSAAAHQAMAVAIWERDPDMSAPSDALEKAESIILALWDAGFVLAARPTNGDS